MKLIKYCILTPSLKIILSLHYYLIQYLLYPGTGMYHSYLSTGSTVLLRRNEIKKYYTIIVYFVNVNIHITIIGMWYKVKLNNLNLYKPESLKPDSSLKFQH